MEEIIVFCPKCKSRTKVVNVQSDRNERKIPKAFRGLNITRRKHRCLHCHEEFYSIESLEDLWSQTFNIREVHKVVIPNV